MGEPVKGMSIARLTLKSGLALVAFYLLFVASAKASCFDRTLVLSRYIYLNPADINQIYQDLFLVDFAYPSNSPVRLTRGALDSPHYDSVQPTFSPNGDKIIFSSQRSGGLSQLFAEDIQDSDNNSEGDNLFQLTNGSGESSDPRWVFPNRLVYISTTTNSTIPHVFSANPDLVAKTLTNIEEFSAGSVEQLSPAPARDGAFVYFVTPLITSTGRSFSINASIKGQSNIISVIDRGAVDKDPALKLGTTTIAFSSDRATAGVADIFTSDVDLNAAPANMVSNVTAITATSVVDETEPQFSPDGLCLAYLSNDNAISYGPNDDLVVRDMVTGETRRMTSSRDISGFSWKP